MNRCSISMFSLPSGRNTRHERRSSSDSARARPDRAVPGGASPSPGARTTGWCFTPSRTLSSTVFHGKIDCVCCWNTNIISERGPAIGSLLRRTLNVQQRRFAAARQADQGDEFAPGGVNRFSRPSIIRVSVMVIVEPAVLAGKATVVYSNPMHLGMWNVLAQLRPSHDGHGIAGGSDCCLRTASSCQFLRQDQIPPKF